MEATSQKQEQTTPDKKAANSDLSDQPSSPLCAPDPAAAEGDREPGDLKVSAGAIRGPAAWNDVSQRNDQSRTARRAGS